MPRFKEYAAPDKAFSEDATGYSAYETAGRRIGPLYNAAGQDLRGAGQAGINAAEAGVRTARDALGLAESNTRLSEDQARQQREQDRQSVTDRTWPYDVLALQGGSGSSRRGGGGGGGGMRLQGPVNPEIDNRTGGYSNDSPSRDRAYSPGRASHAAAGLGRLASSMAQRAPYSRPDGRTRGSPPAEQTFDSDGNLIYDSSQRGNDRHSYGSYLDQGRLVHTRDGQGERLPKGFDPNDKDAANRWAYGTGRNGDYGMANGKGIPTTGDYAGVNPGIGPDYGGGSDAAPSSDSGPSWGDALAGVGNAALTGDWPGSSSSGGDWWSGVTNDISSVFGGSTSGGNYEDSGGDVY